MKNSKHPLGAIVQLILMNETRTCRGVYSPMYSPTLTSVIAELITLAPHQIAPLCVCRLDRSEDQSFENEN
jgi:hypothetical protein